MFFILIRRLAVLPLLLIFVSLIAFLYPYMAGIDPAQAILNSRVAEREPTPEVLAQIRAELDLDQPLPVLYLKWLERMLRGDLGFSYASRAPVGGLLFQGLKVTAFLSVISLILAFVVSFPLGTASALRPGKWLDNLITGLTQIGVAVPEYWFAPLLILLFSMQLRWLPSAGWRGPLFIVMPALTLALRPIAYFTRQARESMIEVLQKDYIRAARARGLTEFQTIWRHAVRNSLIPVVTLATLWLAGLLGGAVIVEVIFAVPGIGRVMYDAAIANDLPVLQAGVVLVTSLAIVINTFTDLAYVALNPAIRLDPQH